MIINLDMRHTRGGREGEGEDGGGGWGGRSLFQAPRWWWKVVQ